MRRSRRRCEEAGITFVGPNSATIRRLGDKVAAKRVAEQADVPVVPWSGGSVDDVTKATSIAAQLGYPLVVKAASGGGGRGIRMVRDDDELAAALPSARAEAQLAFGDPTVFLEKLVPAARHVEVQVIADGYGTVWAVGIRDCSLQRRHQKVLEESASTVLDAAKEEAIRDAAVRLCAAAGYRNAGTVEFLVDPETGSFQFMEVNTRLQVEHPVTEVTTGCDLVKLQLHVAQGGRLTGTQPTVSGHAIEARLNAEDPENGFAPAPGRLARLRLPAGSGIRVDAGVREGDRIPADFDSMIAKIVAWGRDRDEAMARLRRALRETTAVVEGGTTNRSFLLTLLDRPEVRSGHFDNHWLDRLTGRGGASARSRPGGAAGRRCRVLRPRRGRRARRLPRPRRARRGRVGGRCRPPQPAALPGTAVRPARLPHGRPDLPSHVRRRHRGCGGPPPRRVRAAARRR